MAGGGINQPPRLALRLPGKVLLGVNGSPVKLSEPDLESGFLKLKCWESLVVAGQDISYQLPPDETGLLDTGTAHGPLVEGGAVGDGPQRLPGHVRPLRGGEDGPGVPGPDQPLHVPDLLRLPGDDHQQGQHRQDQPRHGLHHSLSRPLQ